VNKESSSLIIIALVVGVGLFIHFFNPGSLPKATTVCQPDLKLCPDGSYVGRTLPNCDFLECGIVSEETSTTTIQ